MAKKKGTSSKGAKSLVNDDLAALKLQVAQLKRLDSLDLAKSAQQKALFAVIAKIRESLDLDSIFKSTAIAVRELLNADRVGMYRFDQTSKFTTGEFVSEDVLPEFASTLAAKINDHCFGEHHSEYYTQGKIFTCADIYQKKLADCHIQILERFQVRANLVVPLLNGDLLWGLLCIHQCSAPRQWLDSEIDFVKQIAAHLDVALQQAEFVAQLQAQSESLARAIEQAVGREKVVAAIINKIRRSLDIDTIFTTTTEEVRQLLQADRVTIYRFNTDWSGEFVVESMAESLVSLVVYQKDHPELTANISECSVKNLAKTITVDTHLQQTQGADFNESQLFRVCNDIYAAGFSSCYIEALEQYQARAYAITAIYKGKDLWGLLAAFQCTNVRQWQESEVNFLVQISTQLGVAIQQAELFGQVQKRSTDLQTTLEIELQKRADKLARDAEQERALARVIERIRQTLDIDTIFQATTQEVRQNLNCDRVVVYRFFDDWSGKFVFESKTDDWLAIEELSNRNNVWEDTHLQENQGGRYRNHESFIVNDIYEANLTECHIEILESYQIRAFIIAPVFVGDKLWGLLAAYQNSGSRDWETSELSLLTQVANQLGVAVQQAELLVQLQKAKEDADRANSAKGDFLAHMSHELRTPLNSILGFTQVLARDTLLNDIQKEHLEIIARSGEHLLTLLNDVLEMSKIEAGLIELNINSFDLYNLLDSLKEMFLLKAKAKKIQLVFDFAANVPQYIQTDESKLRQVLINLVGNAIKFTERGKVILQVTYSHSLEKELGDTDRFLYFEVSDTGPGIAPEELGNLFEAFVQTETGRKSQDGTGLGMPISKRFVRLMGGDIRVASTLGQGTIVDFEIKIQLAKANDVPLPLVKRRAIALAPNQPQYRILLADDKWESRHLMRSLIAPLGFEIHEAENGQEAVEIWRAWKPHLIWMDMQMPVLNGYEATRTIREVESLDSTCKIIALTASVFDKQRSEVLELGCDDFVSKPLREELIFDKIAEHLGVTYIYADSDLLISSNQAKNDQEQFIETELDSLETQWLLDLHLAARGADEEAIFNLLNQIQDTHPNIASVIQDFVHNFHLEEIISLIQPFIDLQANEH